MHRYIDAYVAYINIYIYSRARDFRRKGVLLSFAMYLWRDGGGRKITPKSKQTVKMLKPDTGENESRESLFGNWFKVVLIRISDDHYDLWSALMVWDTFGRAGMRVGYLWDCLDGMGLGWLGVVLELFCLDVYSHVDKCICVHVIFTYNTHMYII